MKNSVSILILGIFFLFACCSKDKDNLENNPQDPDLPHTFSMYRTNSESDNCSLIKDIKPGTPNAFILPSKSIITLQAGGDAL